MSSWKVLLSLLATAVGFCACSSSTQSLHPTQPVAPSTVVHAGGHPGVVVITGSSAAVAAASVGDLVEVQLTSGAFGRDGHVVPWGTPISANPAILTPTRSSSGIACRPEATCTFFAARGPGDATISAIEPSGILCNKHGDDCVGVTAPLWRVDVDITAR
jgi:hypothetical protein